MPLYVPYGTCRSVSHTVFYDQNLFIEEDTRVNTTQNAPVRTSKLGGTAAILIGMINVLLIIYVIVTPSQQRYDVGEGLRYFAESPLALSLAWIMFAITAVLSYAVIPVVADIVEDVSRDWTRMASIYGIAGYTVLAASFLTLIGFMPELARAYVNGDEIARTAIVATGLPETDPHGFLMFGGPATWLIVVNVLALRGRKLPVLHAWSGIILGLGHWGTVVADVFEIETLNLAAAGAGALFYPIWFVWLGLQLLRGVPQS